MSLLLRKECQKALDSNNLQNYHVEINTGSPKCLRIVGECGKPLINIYGIVFNRQTPTTAETEYAVELLDAFIAKHVLTIKHYVSKIKTLPKQPKPEKGFSLRFNEYSNDRYYCCEYNDSLFNIELYVGNKIRITQSRDGFGTVDVKEFNSFKLNTKLHSKANRLLNENVAYQEALLEIDILQDKLNTCTI